MKDEFIKASEEAAKDLNANDRSCFMQGCGWAYAWYESQPQGILNMALHDKLAKKQALIDELVLTLEKFANYTPREYASIIEKVISGDYAKVSREVLAKVKESSGE
jgi:hypothetical protein